MAEFPEDALQIMPETDIDKLYQVLKKEWPFSVYSCGFLKTSYDWCKKKPDFDVSFFYCKDDIESGIFVAVLKSGHRTFGLVIYALEGQESKLKNILLKTKKINWEGLPILQGVLPRHMKLLEDVVKIKGLCTSTRLDSILQLLHPELTINYDIRYPDDVYVATLTKEHMNLIYDNWVLNDFHTSEDIINSIELGFSYGVFSKVDNELLAWLMQSHYGAIGVLYTKEHARRHGYAKILAMKMAKDMVDEGIPPFVMMNRHNTKSISLFHSIGFEPITRVKYLKVGKGCLETPSHLK